MKNNNRYNYKKLEKFFNEIAQLTGNHDVINGGACVYVDKLAISLEKIDPEWYKINKAS